MSTPTVESVKLDDLDCWRINYGDSELLVSKQGAQVLSYQLAGEQPLIWLNEEAVFETGRPVRAGVPVCWPWFGNLAKNPAEVQAMRQSNAPAGAHGLVRARDWTLKGIHTEPNLVVIDFTLDNPVGTFPEWPHHVSASLQIRMDHYLHISLTSHNLGDTPVSLSQALHSYFAVSDVREVSVEGVEGLHYIDTLDDWKTHEQHGALHFTGETDRIYTHTPARLNITDPTWGRRISLQTTGSKTAVIWNPWIDKAASFSDMAKDGWQRMLCIETANLMDDIVTLAPGESHTMGVSLWSEKLEVF